MFDPEDFLDLADSLISSPSPTEAQLRCAISRAYYALFLKARENLASSRRIVITGSGRDHRAVIHELKRAGGVQGHVLDKLLIGRNEADYDLHISPTISRTLQTVQTAKLIWPAL